LNTPEISALSAFAKFAKITSSSQLRTSKNADDTRRVGLPTKQLHYTRGPAAASSPPALAMGSGAVRRDTAPLRPMNTKPLVASNQTVGLLRSDHSHRRFLSQEEGYFCVDFDCRV